LKKILLLEDDPALGQGICLALKSEDLQIDRYRLLSEARNQRISDYALLILDINLPDGSGLDYLRELRTDHCSIPVILLTANDMETDVVVGLESGADDYITKPFSLAILRARVNTQLRREQKQGVSLYQSDPFLFDFDHMVFRKSGLQIELSKTEQKLLRILLDNRGMTVSRSVLVDRIWSDGAEYVDENALSVTMKRLRDKLEDDPSKPAYLKTVYGLGYTWAVK
jgi:DNA-binding response OmpR family regulator